MGHFLHFYPPNIPKKSKFKKIKKIKKIPEDIIILDKCTKNHDHMIYCSWDMMHDRCNCYFSFQGIFCPFTLLITQKIKVLKKWKKMPGDIIILHMCTKNYDQMMYSSWDMVSNRQTDEQMDRHTEKVTLEVPHLKNLYSVWKRGFSPNNVLIASDQIQSNNKQQRNDKNDKNITEILWSMEIFN